MIRAAHEVSHLSAVERIAVGVMAFATAFMNGVPYFASSGFICLVGIVVLAISQIRQRGLVLQLPASSAPMLMAWGLWFFAATIATVANLKVLTVVEWFWLHLLPFLLFILFLGLKPNRSDVIIFIVCITGGWLLRYSYAGFVFYQSWGLLGPADMLLAHFRLDRMQPYMSVTFGNTSRTAALLVPALVLIALVLAIVRTGRWLKAMLIVALAVILYNTFVTGSRAQIIVVVLALGVAGLKSSRRGGLLIILTIAAALVALMEAIGAAEVSRFASVFSSDRLQDGSVRERWDSIQEGMAVMGSNWLGVGPGRSPEFSYYSVAHQFAVFQGSEVGWMGFLAVIALFVLSTSRFLMLPMSRGRELKFVFAAAAASWLIFAMLANVPLGLGPNMPWVAMLAMLMALSEVAPLSVDRGRPSANAVRTPSGSQPPL